MTDHELRDWCEAHTRGVMLNAVAIATKRVLAERDQLKRDNEFLIRELQVVRELLAQSERKESAK